MLGRKYFGITAEIKVCRLKHTFSSMFSNENVYLFKSAHFKATYICAEVAQILGIKYEVKNE